MTEFQKVENTGIDRYSSKHIEALHLCTAVY